MKRSTYVAFIILASILCCGTQEASACVCGGEMEPPCAAYQGATAVFVGEVSGIEKEPRLAGDTFDELLIRFSVKEAFKGISETEITLCTVTGTDCNLEFKMGQRYFVYAYPHRFHNRLAAGGICSRTGRLNAQGGDEDLDYARDLKRSITSTAILGTYGDSPKRLKGVKVVIEGEGKKYETKANRKGAFSVRLDKPGDYRIGVISPAGHELLPIYPVSPYEDWQMLSIKGRIVFEIRKTIDKGGCTFIDLSRWELMPKKP